MPPPLWVAEAFFLQPSTLTPEEAIAYQRRDFPEFSWSHSRDRLLRECPRKYWWRYYGGHNGWERDAEGTDAWWAWRLSKLTSYPIALGSAIHEIARVIAVRIQDGAELPTEPDLIERIRVDLNTLWRNRSRRSDFLARPKEIRLTSDDYYGAGVPPHRLRGIRELIPQLVAAILHSPVWDEIRENGHEIIVLDSLEACRLDGHLIYAAPDLVYGSEVDGWTIVDWKTGRVNDVELQLAVYGLYLQIALGMAPGSQGFRGLAVGLADGTIDEIRVTDDTITATGELIRSSIQTMGHLLDDVGQNRPKPMTSFPMTTNRQRCQWCEYRQVCLDEHPVP